jgi:predicted Zn finger-like uncharacterized protein
VRFACGSCGRVYVMDDRIGGRAFRMRCKRCGHVISVAPAPPPTPAPEKGGPPPGAEAGQVAEPQPVADPAPSAVREPAGVKGRLALLLLVGVAAVGGGVWFLRAPARRSAPPAAERPREVASTAAQTASIPPVGAPPRPAEPAVTAPTTEPVAAPAAEPVAAPTGATPKAGPREARKRAAPPVAASAPARSAAGPAPASRAGTESAATPAAPTRGDLPPRDEQQIQATFARYAASFDGCVAEARRDEPDLLASPRPVVVTMTVRPSGKTLYPTLDDAQLSGTALGACVKKQSARMVFPESGGEPVRVRMPLVLGR